MSVQPLDSGYTEKRRHVRQPTLQAARIFIGDGAAISVEIRDYCQSGLHISFLGEGTPDAAVPALIGTPVLIEMAHAAPGGLRFKGRIARVTPHSVGVFVLAMPEAALELLRRVDASSASTRGSPGDGVASVDLPAANALRLECSRLFSAFVDAVMQDFFQHAQQHLNQAGMETFSFLERSRLDYGAQELALHRSHIETEIRNSIRDGAQTIEPAQAASGKATPILPPVAGKLALIDEDEFEDWLSLSAVIKPIETDIAPQLYVFELRYGRLIGVPIDRKNNPLGPEALGRAFQSAIRVLDFSNAMRTILYKALGQALSDRSASAYEQLNQLLISLQPDEPVRSPPVERAQDPQPEVDTARSSGDTDLAENPDTALARALANLFQQDHTDIETTGAESTDYSLDRILSSLGHMRRSTPSQPEERAVSSARHLFDASRDRAVVLPEMLKIARQIRQSVHQLDRQKSQPPVETVRQPVSSYSAAEASLGEIKRVLDRLPLSTPAAPDGMPPGSLSEQIDAYIASDQGEARQLAPMHRRVLDSTAEFFVRTRADVVPRSDIESLLQRMEKPLLKLALQDASFPDMPDHPARQVINLIEQFTVAADDDGKLFDAKLRRFLFLLVDRIVSRADEDPGIFVTVREQLAKVLGPILQIRRTRIARMQEACEGRDRIRSARSRVNAALEQRLGGREVPGLILRLLDAGWRQYLVLLEMREGARSEAWDAAFAVLDRLLRWLGSVDETTARSATAAAALLSEIERSLMTVNVDTHLLAAFMDEVGACLETGGGQDATALATIHVPPGRLARQTADRSEVHAATHQRLLDRMRAGDWWYIEVAGQPVPMQLVWTSQLNLIAAFANRSATRRQEFTLAELSRHIQDGLAKPGRDMDMPVIERSEHALFDETYQDLLHHVLHDETTGLLNRKGFIQRLNLLDMPEDNNHTHAVGILEFDQFRMIYNTCGVEAVETLARTLAQEARDKMGPGAVLASFREDTLAILLPNCSRVTGCQSIDPLLDQMRDFRFRHELHSYSIGFNIGVAEFSPAQISVSEAIRRADSACITAKTQGRNRMQIYEEASPQLLTQEHMMDWAGRIDSFLTGKGLHLRCQRVMPLDPDAPHAAHYEILLAIDDENGAEINPMHFIPAVERLQRAHEIDMWVIRNVFAWIADNRKKFDALGGFAINLSATSLSSPEVIAYLKAALQACNFPTHKITFEITETAAIGSYGAAQDFIREIRRYGCRFALDDFGSGFTSYSHLKNLRTDSLKIDGSFVKDMLNNPGDHAMVKSMNDIAHSLGLKTIAEYAESPMILQALREIGVDYAQGYAVHKPCSIDEVPCE